MRTKTEKADWRSTWHAMKSRLKDLEVITIIVAFTIVAAILGFAALADDVMEGDTRSFDLTILESLRQVGDNSQLIGPGWLEYFATNVTALGSWTVSVFIVLAVAGFLAIRRAWLELMLVVGGTIGGALVMSTLKSVFERARPDVVPHLVEVSSLSFPSGHALVSAVMYLTLGTLVAEFVTQRALKAYVMGVALFTTFCVGVTRVLLGVHYPTDVLGGWCIGLAWALSCWLGVRYLQFRLSPEEFKLRGTREDSAKMGDEEDDSLLVDDDDAVVAA